MISWADSYIICITCSINILYEYLHLCTQWAWVDIMQGVWEKGVEELQGYFCPNKSLLRAYILQYLEKLLDPAFRVCEGRIQHLSIKCVLSFFLSILTCLFKKINFIFYYLQSTVHRNELYPCFATGLSVY